MQVRLQFDERDRLVRYFTDMAPFKTLPLPFTGLNIHWGRLADRASQLSLPDPMSAAPPTSLLSTLRDQGAPPPHLQRVAELVMLAERDPALLAMFLVGSYARGNGDRISDLDLVAFAQPDAASEVLRAAHEVLIRHEILNQFTGTHPSGGCFWKIVYLDFSSVEFHVFEPGTSFRLKRPYLTVWDPDKLAAAYVVEGEPVAHADFQAYQYGDEGLIWELVDYIKWLSRGRNELARHHLEKLVAEVRKHPSSHGGGSAARGP